MSGTTYPKNYAPCPCCGEATGYDLDSDIWFDVPTGSEHQGRHKGQVSYDLPWELVQVSFCPCGNEDCELYSQTCRDQEIKPSQFVPRELMDAAIESIGFRWAAIAKRWAPKTVIAEREELREATTRSRL